MNCVSCEICVYHLGLCVCFPWGIPQLQSDWSLSCDHGLDYANNNNNVERSSIPKRLMSRRCRGGRSLVATATAGVAEHLFSSLTRKGARA